MDDAIANSADISSEDCTKLFNAFEVHYSQENTPASYLNSLSQDLQLEFYNKIEQQCKQVLIKGYKSWAYKKYRFDHNGDDGVMNLNSDVQEWLMASSLKESFVNLKEIFKNGPDYINRNLRNTIRRVLAAKRDTTVIDRLLRRIEELVDDKTSEFARSRGPKEDYFTLTNKFPEQREPSNEEIENVISRIGNFREEPPKANALQAPRIYSTPILSQMFHIICDTLETEVTPNILEIIFLDLIPGFLPPEFVTEKAFKIYGHVSFPIDLGSQMTLSDLNQEEILLVKEAVGDCLREIEKLGIQDQVITIREHLKDGNLRINALAKTVEFRDREEVEKVLEKIGAVVNKIFSTLDEDIAEVAFSEFFLRI